MVQPCNFAERGMGRIKLSSLTHPTSCSPLIKQSRSSDRYKRLNLQLLKLRADAAPHFNISQLFYHPGGGGGGGGGKFLIYTIKLTLLGNF